MGMERGHLERCMQAGPFAVDGSDSHPSVSLEAEVPEVLFDGMRAFLEANPRWDQYSLVTSALASFLFQHGCSDGSVIQHYLDGLFSQR